MEINIPQELQEEAKRLFSEKSIESLFSKTFTDRAALIRLKHFAVKNQAYEFASNLRDIEVKLYPKSHTESEEKQRVKQVLSVLALADIKTDERMAYKLDKLFEAFHKMGEDIDIKTISKIKAVAIEIFGPEEY